MKKAFMLYDAHSHAFFEDGFYLSSPKFHLSVMLLENNDNYLLFARR